MTRDRAGKIHFDDLPMHAGGDLIGNGLVPVMPDQEVRHRDGEIRNNPPASVKIVSINDRVNHVSAQFNSAVRSQKFRHNPTPFAVFNRRTFLEQHLNSYRATPIAKRLCVTAQDLDRLSHVADNHIHSVYGVSPDCLFDIGSRAFASHPVPPALSLKAQTQAARSILHRPPGRAAPTSQRRISRADTAPRLNAAMSQSLDARQDLIGQCLSRRSWGDAQPAKPSPIRSAAEVFRHG